MLRPQRGLAWRQSDQEVMMIPALVTLLGFQLAGEVLSRALALPLPGPVLGMLGLVAAFGLFPRLVELVRPTAQGLLANLSLLFVPAGVGVVAHLHELEVNALAIGLALVVSTPLAIVVGALVFTGVARLTEGRAVPAEDPAFAEVEDE
jgi:holin-like protein